MRSSATSKGSLTAEEAGELLGLSARHFRYEVDGVDGLRDKRLGRVSNRRAPEGELARMRRLCLTYWAGSARAAVRLTEESRNQSRIDSTLNTRAVGSR